MGGEVDRGGGVGEGRSGRWWTRVGVRGKVDRGGGVGEGVS